MESMVCNESGFTLWIKKSCDISIMSMVTSMSVVILILNYFKTPIFFARTIPNGIGVTDAIYFRT